MQLQEYNVFSSLRLILTLSRFWIKDFASNSSACYDGSPVSVVSHSRCLEPIGHGGTIRWKLFFALALSPSPSLSPSLAHTHIHTFSLSLLQTLTHTLSLFRPSLFSLSSSTLSEIWVECQLAITITLIVGFRN